MIEIFYIKDEVAHVQAVQGAIRRFTTMFNAMVEYMKQYCQRLCELVEQCLAAMKSAGFADDKGNPVHRENSRPAWASPYGPAPKRIRR